MKKITEVAKRINLKKELLECFGESKAKIDFQRVKGKQKGKLIILTAMTPTKFGEGKTTTSIGLAQALWRKGKKSVACIREPSLGPVFGIKGGGTGGGKSKLEPSTEINLQFTGDIPAVGEANNLLSALVDNHIQHGNRLKIDTKNITLHRCIDMDDRALREIEIGQCCAAMERPRKEAFQITASSEVMAVLSLSGSYTELKKQLGNIVFGYDKKGKALRAKQLKAEGAMAALLSKALKPNLVQTREETPAIVHGGAFANIAFGTSSSVATELALKKADYVVQESGFGSDLGFEKFCNIYCRQAGFSISAVVIVATVRSLEEQGIENMQRHVEIVKGFGFEPIVALNRFKKDSKKELEALIGAIEGMGIKAVVADPFHGGGKGCEELANAVIKASSEKAKKPKYTYSKGTQIRKAVEAIAKKVYGAGSISFSKKAEKSIRLLEKNKLDKMPVCMAKTQYSFTGDLKRKGAPQGFCLKIDNVSAAAGAGFIVARCGKIMSLPGLPKTPAAERIGIDGNGKARGI